MIPWAPRAQRAARLWITSKESISSLPDGSQIADELLDDLVIDHGALACNNNLCHDPSHIENIERLCGQLISTCLNAGKHSLPKCAPPRGRVPMWNERIKPLRDDSLFWHWLWKEDGRPPTGVLASVMRNTRAKYHRTVKLHKREELKFRRCTIANASKSSTSRDCWKEIKKLDSVHKVTPSTLDGFSDDSDIADNLANKYRNLYSSVPTSTHELTVLRADIVKDILEDTGSDISCISVFEICNAIISLKHEKSDGLRGTASDHFINASHRFKVLISLMVQSMFIHGYTPNGLLESVLISIPKDARGDLCSSDNYRGIALCSALCKVIDIIVIERYREKLLTSELQFAFKALHSTSMCTTVVKEVCNYYRARGTNVYICMLDASKAFDRVHYGKLFNLLRQRNLPPTITRLLLDMYTRQRLYASWNGEISDPFQTQNGVKQGGILSPILFCVYIDELLRRIDSSGLGCHIGHLSYAGVGYADDVGLLAPSVQALQKLIRVCEDFARDYNVSFNAKKTVCMRVGSSGEPPTRVVTLNGAAVMWKQRIKHLGNIITSDLNDKCDIEYKKGVFISHVNRLNNKLSVVSANVKGQLLQTYCCSWYGCQTWDLVSKSAQTMAVEWNKAVRRTLGIPYTTHTALLPGITGSKPFKEQHTSRVFKFISSFLSSNNEHVLLIGERARFCAVGALGRNWARRAMAVTAAPPCADSLASTQAIQELLDVRDGVTSMPDFSNDEITLLIDYMCCSWVKRRTPVNLVSVGSFNL